MFCNYVNVLPDTKLYHLRTVATWENGIYSHFTIRAFTKLLLFIRKSLYS